jgi:hypothetical protein
MEKFQIDQFDMLLAVENHFNDNTPPWTTNVPVAAAKTQLSAKIAGIGTQLAIQLVNTTGITEDKQVARQRLEAQAFTISAAISGYATATGNGDLYNRTHFAKSAIAEYRDTELIGLATNLILDANAQITNLAPYGILPATITTFVASQTAFAAIMKNPVEAIGRRKAATEKIATLLPDAMVFLTTALDNLMVALEATQPNFVDIYNNVRQINSSPTNPWSLTTTCLDSVTQLPIKDVTIRIADVGIVRTSPESGFNTYQNVKEGEHTLEASHPNYTTQSVTFTVVGNQTTELPILLVEVKKKPQI